MTELIVEGSPGEASVPKGAMVDPHCMLLEGIFPATPGPGELDQSIAREGSITPVQGGFDKLRETLRPEPLLNIEESGEKAQF